MLKGTTPLAPSGVHPITRRSLMAGGGALAAAATLSGTPAKVSVAATMAGGAGPAGSRTFAYVGTYTDRGKGIHLLEMDRQTGKLTPVREFADIPSPSSLILSPDRKFLFAVSEVTEFQGTGSGSVSAFAVDHRTGGLTLINTVSSEGTAPCHVGIDPEGKFLFVSNYLGGSVAVVPVSADGRLGKATDVQRISGPLGPVKAKDAPPGSFAESGHDAPHAHMAGLDPTGKFLLVCDLGTDRIYIYRFDRTSGKLTANEPAFVQASPGAGPRHFAFHSNGRFAYSLNEEASTVDMMEYDGGKGALTIRQTLPTLPAGFEGTNYPSEIAVSADDRFLYTANRLHDSIAIFAIGADGRLTPAGQEWTRGSYPRHFETDPSGRFFYVLHSRSDNITCFTVDRQSGKLEFTGQYTGVGNPSKIVFLAV